MKNKNGITLTSVLIYVIVMFVAVATVGTITSFFYSKSQSIENSSKGLNEFNKFNACFLSEVKKEGNGIKSIKDNQIVFTDGTSFTFAGDGIYENKVKICTSVNECTFSSYNQEEKVIVGVYLKIGNEFAKNIEYVMQYNNMETVKQYEENY